MIHRPYSGFTSFTYTYLCVYLVLYNFFTRVSSVSIAQSRYRMVPLEGSLVLFIYNQKILLPYFPTPT